MTGARIRYRTFAAALFLASVTRTVLAQPAGGDLLDPSAIGTAPSSPLLSGLHGRWAGSGIEIAIDTVRMQGNTDPRKPFAWEALAIRDVTPPWIVFVIGRSTFVAQVEGEVMTLTQPGWSSPRIVARAPASRPNPLRGSVEPAPP